MHIDIYALYVKIDNKFQPIYVSPGIAIAGLYIFVYCIHLLSSQVRNEFPSSLKHVSFEFPRFLPRNVSYPQVSCN